MALNIHERVVSELNRRAVPWTEVSRATGIPYETIKKIGSRRTPNPGVRHVQALADYFDALAVQGAAPEMMEVAHG